MTSPTRRARWRRLTGWLLVVVLGVGTLTVFALAASPPRDPMGPEDVSEVGGAALVAVLEQHGVEVETMTSIDALTQALEPRDDDTTVVVANPANLGTAAAGRLRRASQGVERIVLLSPSTEQLTALGADLTARSLGIAVPVTSRCDIGVVDEGDTVTELDSRYEPDSDGSTAAARTCFPLTIEAAQGESTEEGEHGVGFVALPAQSGRAALMVFGGRFSFTNGHITEEDNAAIALRLLGGTSRLLWYHPGVADLADDDSTGGGLLPAWFTPSLGLLAAALVVLALVRGRRLGRLVPEPLPVVVRAVETTESRGRLYRRAQDRPRAAAVLRLATLDRLRGRLGLGRSDPIDVVARATSAATGRPVAEVLDLVAGPHPIDDAALVRLAQDLSDLEEKAHRP